MALPRIKGPCSTRIGAQPKRGQVSGRASLACPLPHRTSLARLTKQKLDKVAIFMLDKAVVYLWGYVSDGDQV